MVSHKRHFDAAFEAVIASSAMKRVERVVQVVAPKDVTLTLIGESGSGKEVLARRAHDLSPRRRGPFVPINCAAIPDALFESELFGHERGAFTGANELVRGKVEAAAHGTLFLDEIGETPLLMQAKLLRFLENRRFMRVGGATKLQADVRLIFATLRPLEDEVQAGRFRADLFYRIQGITVVVPPLRERRADIGPLWVQFVRELSTRHGVRPPHLTRAAKALLLSYSWPGNVRELRNAAEALCLLREGRAIRPSDLPKSMRASPTATKPTATKPTATKPTPTKPARMKSTDADSLATMKRRLVEAALVEARGDTGAAATRLGISRRTLQRLVASGEVTIAGIFP